MPRVEIKTEIDLDIKTGAEWFCDLSDDEQCKFFVEVARIMDGWPGGGDSQLYYIGGHLKNCKCSTPEAREMIRALAQYAETSEHN